MLRPEYIDIKSQRSLRLQGCTKIPIKDLGIVPLKIFNENVTNLMYTMDLKDLKEFGHIVCHCSRQNIDVVKNQYTKENLKKNIINFLSRLSIKNVKNFLLIITMDFNPKHDDFSSEKSNLLFLRNKSESIIDTLSGCS
jgi:hypothetical protein